jgi:hypothetical protein
MQKRPLSNRVLGNWSYIDWLLKITMNNQFRKGDVVRAFVDGQHRDLVIDEIASNGRLSQCYWLQGGSKQFVMVFLGAVQKVQDALVPVREDE